MKMVVNSLLSQTHSPMWAIRTLTSFLDQCFFAIRFLFAPRDNVEWDAAQEQLALDKVTENAASKMTPEEQSES